MYVKIWGFAGLMILTLFKSKKLNSTVKSSDCSFLQTELNELSTQVFYSNLVQLIYTRWIIEYLPYHFQS